MTSRTQSHSVLVVEDEGLIAMELQHRLEGFGYTVPAVAATADDAVRLAAYYTPDLILMDIRLRGKKDGIEAADEIRRLLDIPVIFVTAHADLDTLQRAKVTEPFGYIVKPFGKTDFRAHIEMAHYKHQMERRLRHAHARLSSTLSSVGEAVITADAEQRIELLNPMAELLTGWKCQEAQGRLLRDVFRVIESGNQAEESNPLSAIPRNPEPFRFECRVLLHRDQLIPRLVSGVLSGIRSEDQWTGSVLSFRDITAQRELEKQAEQGRRMETVSIMAGAIAHDFNNLLTVILGYADRLQSDPGRSSVAANEILQAGELATALCRQLLTVSRRSVLRPEVFDLNSVIRASEKMLLQILGPASRVSVNPCPEPLYVRADRAELQQVVLNLAVNARDAMPQGGLFTIGSRSTGAGEAEIVVEDSGTGMTEQTREHIFEPFFSRKADKGTGLGMTIVHSVITRWGGNIAVTSELGRGTRFHIRLPLSDALPAASKTPPRETVSEQASGGTILLADDNEVVRRLLREQFLDAGYQVLDAGSGEEALSLLELAGNTIDLLITDVMMPRITGPELARRCVAKLPRLKVLFLSGYGADALKGDELLQSRRAEFVSKPVNLRDLIAKAQSMIKSVR